MLVESPLALAGPHALRSAHRGTMANSASDEAERYAHLGSTLVSHMTGRYCATQIGPIASAPPQTVSAAARRQSEVRAKSWMALFWHRAEGCR